MNFEINFKQDIEFNKLNTIFSALIIFENEGIYEKDIMGDYRYSYFKGQDRALDVAKDLFIRAKFEEDQELYDQIYEMCWKKINLKEKNELAA